MIYYKQTYIGENIMEEHRKRILKVISVLRKHKKANLERLSDMARIADDVIDKLKDEFKQDRGL